MTQRAQHRVTQQEAQGQMASAVSEKPEVAQFRRREERLKNELKPLKEIEILKDKGLLSNDQYRDLKQALTGQQYPEAHKALNEWFAQNNWKSAPPPDLPKECFANILDYNLKGFSNQIPIKNRIANEVEKQNIPAEWEEELANFLR